MPEMKRPKRPFHLRPNNPSRARASGTITSPTDVFRSSACAEPRREFGAEPELVVICEPVPSEVQPLRPSRSGVTGRHEIFASASEPSSDPSLVRKWRCDSGEVGAPCWNRDKPGSAKGSASAWHAVLMGAGQAQQPRFTIESGRKGRRWNSMVSTSTSQALPGGDGLQASARTRSRCHHRVVLVM